MLENFHLAAIVKQGNRTRLFEIPLDGDLQCRLAESWQIQFDAFVEGIEEISFTAGYLLEEEECFVLEDFSLPDWLENKNSKAEHGLLEPITTHDGLLDSIKGTVGFARNCYGEELVLFQNFTRSQVIRPGRSLFLSHDTYVSNERPGLTLDVKLSAVYLYAQNKLLFRSYRTVNTFLPLAEFYRDASEQEIREVLDHDLLTPEDVDFLAGQPSQWFRKRFAMLKDSEVLDRYTAEQIRERSQGYSVDVEITNGKIVFPADKPAAKKVLQFLNEEIFRGPITETVYETNSKRQAD